LPGVPVTGWEDALPVPGALLIAVPDDDLPGVARDLRRRLPTAVKLVLHTSGLHGASILRAAAAPGRHFGSFHPLVPFPTAAGPAVRLVGATAGLEGDRTAVAAGHALAGRLEMFSVRVRPEAKARYHAAAAVAATLTHALVVAACEELEGAGFSPAAARRALAPLVGAAVDGALAARGWERLTGPLVRGDAATIVAHRRALSPSLASVYEATSRLALEHLEAAGIIDGRALRLTSRALTGRGFRVSVRAMAPDGGR
jgi:predicted short-subunit dehydrogenase-like oxidoreductase (DUF2520 family)